MEKGLTKEMDRILTEMRDLSVPKELPKSYHIICIWIWSAFRLGVEYKEELERFKREG